MSERREEMGGLAGVRAEGFTFASHALAAAAAALVLVWCIHFRGGLAFESTNKSLIFNVHPVLMLIGFIIIGSEAIMSYRALPFSKEVKKLIHLILHAIALVLGAVGIYAAFKYHNESGIANLYSLHSWIGLGTICLYGIQWIFGFVTFFYPGASLAFKRVALPWHVLFGLFVYILAVGAAELGFLEKLTFLENSGLAKYSSEAFLVNFTALVVIFLGACVVISTIAPYHVEDPHDYTAVSDD
ncbi:probable ascorbate-specific transmembrane electron transporter 1 [Phoenix dactylifera]|uniref:Probable ascorbate-specific transmembrane electron transporter 1 n=1 Tax=Phoenix dactylifera TaxID=42345 RepID=A0A8B7BJQ9_PHODC|nr:probable ascorbate-specific transmembrane electron transporter 1 [Phoenix dactylifera]